MGFHLGDTGLEMVLDKEVPEKIAEHFTAIIYPFLEDHGVSIEDINHLVFHPGGRKIIDTVQMIFSGLGKNLDDTTAVLREYGNMSSATILYVLERCMDKKIKAGEKGLMLSFGPGFSAQRILLQW
jgi:predicted naringenin-chalcone synthase